MKSLIEKEKRLEIEKWINVAKCGEICGFKKEKNHGYEILNFQKENDGSKRGHFWYFWNNKKNKKIW